MRKLIWCYRVLCVLSMTTILLAPSFAATEEEESQQVPMEEVQRFSNAIGLIKKYYVKNVDDKVLFENAIRGMLNGLDPHSSYLDESEYAELQTATSGEFGGLGIEVSMEDDVIKVITPLVDTPAYNAGIKSEDYIIKIGSQSVQGMKLKDAVDLMRGKIGSKIDLVVIRKGASKPLVFNLKREKIIIKSVKAHVLDNNYGYVRITQFQALTPEEMKKAIASLKKDSGGNLKGMILDLRNNPGGLLDSAIQVSDAFLDKTKQGAKPELIVYTEGRFPGSEFKAVANPGDILQNAPLVVLINHGSASASEIVAGALKDNKRAIIVGTQSFGKGSVQTVLPVDDKRAIKLTTALYYTPSGVSIQAKGITPDIIVEEMKIPKVAVNNDGLDFSEASLSGHIVNKTDQKKQTGLSSKKPSSEEALMHEDYQLYSALTILRGIVVAGH